MYLPINGRVVIIDNDINEVKPLFKTFSKYRVPYIFIDGSDMDWLPSETNEDNDVRLIFLDLNLTGDRTPNPKEIQSSLYPILKSVISPENFPYSIILWSKQEGDYKQSVEELFLKELKDRRPISIENFIKSDFFDLDGEEEKSTDKNIMDEIKKIFQKHQAYSTLVYWENSVHKAADNTLQEIFTSYDDNWVNKTNFIIDKLSRAYLGANNHNKSSYILRTKGALQAFNNVFYDTLESKINLFSNIDDQPLLKYDDSSLIKDTILDTLNYRLIASDVELELDYTGIVNEDQNPKSDEIFKALFTDTLNHSLIESEIPKFNDLSGNAKKRELSKKRETLRENWKKTYVVVTPLCDKVQNKHKSIRLVKGFILEKENIKYLDQKSEAIYISPSFFLTPEEKSFVLVLNFRYFTTFSLNNKILDNLKHIKPIFRLRSSIVAEIQSKLGRHINRQGILYI